MSLPDPEPEQKKTTNGKRKTTMAMVRAGRKGKRIRFFVGSLEPLLAVRRRRRNRRRSASWSALNDARDANSDDGDEDGNNPDEGGDIDVVDADDDGVWPGEYVVPAIVVTEPEPEPETAGARITPEEMERAIGAAFAIGATAS